MIWHEQITVVNTALIAGRLCPKMAFIGCVAYRKRKPSNVRGVLKTIMTDMTILRKENDMEYFSKDDVLNLLNRNSITKKITLADGVSIYDSVKNLPIADVVPKSEVESINPIQEAIEQKKKENKESALGVLNELLDEKDAEIKRLKAENKTLQGELVIWKQDRFNLYQRLELYKIAREKVAREIFEEIDKIRTIERAAHKRGVEDCYNSDSEYAELKKKYTESEDKP